MGQEFMHNKYSYTKDRHPEDSKKVFFSKTSQRLLSYFKRQYKRLLIIICLLFISILCNIYAPYLLGVAIDECVSIAYGLNTNIDFHQLKILLLQFITINLLSAVCNWGSEYGMATITQRIAKELSEDTFDKLNNLSINYFDSTQRGHILSHFTNDIELIKETLGATFIQLLSGALTLIGAVIVMYNISPSLTLITGFTLPIVVLLSRFIISNTRKHFQQQQECIGRLNGLVEESINGLTTIQSFVNEEEIYQKFTTANEAVRESGIKSQIYSGILMPLMRVLDSFGYILTTIFGAFFVLKGYISIGNVQSFFLYVKNFQRPIFSLMSQVNSLQAALVGAERIFQLLDNTNEEPRNSGIELVKSEVKGEIEFKELHFGYTPSHEILKGVSFKVAPGEVVAIVGTTGAGKSTLFNLLSGMYQYARGSIQIDGQEIKELAPKNLRSILGVVQQDPIVFSETLRFNIAYGKPEATDNEIRRIIDLTHSKHLIERLPNGFNQHLKEISGQISQGQRQLLTIARAFLPDTPILLLDEATSNLDTRSETQLQEALKSLIKDKTCLIIAHRLNTIKNANKILVLDKGVIAEKGTHAELLQKQGIYYDIYRQFWQQ